MVFVAKLSLKSGPTTSITTSYKLGPRSNISQNPINKNTTNSIKELDFILDNNDRKTNIIVTISNTNIS